MSTDGSSDWVGPLLIFNLVGIIMLVLIFVVAYRTHKQRTACEERGGVLVVAGETRICVDKKAIIED